MHVRWTRVGVIAAIAIATFVAYWPAWFGTPVWDDAGHITRADLRTLDGLWRIWTTPGATQQYYPLTHTAFWMQAQLWGDTWLGYHLVSISLHVISACLLGVLLERLAVRGAWLAAAVFALHPVHVESVAWMSELKNTLSGVLFLGALLAYQRFDDTRRAGVWWAAAGLFGMALLSKTVAATLPAVILVMIWWQRGHVTWRRDVRPLAPFLALGVVMAVVTVQMERVAIGAVGDEFALAWGERVLVAGRATWFYLGSLAWPGALSFNYPRWVLDTASLTQWLYPMALVAVMGLLVAGRGWWGRGPAAVLAAFVVMAAPALGFVSVYPFRFSFVADHFQYLASLAAIAGAAAAVAGLAARRLSRGVQAAAALVVVGVLASLTWAQSHHYQSEEHLYRATLERNPESWLAHVNLASLLLAKTSPPVSAALAHARAAADGRPDSPVVQYTLGQALEMSGEPRAAAVHYRAALINFGAAAGRHVRLSQLHHRLGAVLAATGQIDEARASLREALRHDDRNADIHSDLGMVLAEARDLEGATAHFTRAADLRPSPAAWTNLAGVIMQAGRYAEAVPLLEKATAADPSLVQAFQNLGIALVQLDRLHDALAAFRHVLQLDPEAPRVRQYVQMLEARIGGAA